MAEPACPRCGETAVWHDTYAMWICPSPECVSGARVEKPTIPEVLPLVREFVRRPGNAVGGHLHLVLDEGNVLDDHVRYCMEQARDAGDELAVEVAEVLLRMSKTQRSKLGKMVWDG